MNEIITETNWESFLREYSARNEGRPTRLGVIETNDGVANDYWIEDGLPLLALDVYSDKGKTRVDVFLENYTHPIEEAMKLVRIQGDGNDNGLDIVDGAGKTTVLRFENWKVEE